MVEGVIKMPTKMSYDPKTQSWVPSSASDSGSVSTSSASSSSTPSTADSSSSSTKSTTSKSSTQVKSAATAEKTQAVLEYNTLEGEITLKASVGVLKIKQGDTITLSGVGSYLSGLYFVTNVTRTLDSSSGFSETCTVIKTGFGKSLKDPSIKAGAPAASTPASQSTRAEKIAVNTASTFQKGDNVKIVGDNAVYSNNVKVPNWVKQKTLTVSSLSGDSTKVLLQPICSWVYTKFVQKV